MLAGREELGPGPPRVRGKKASQDCGIIALNIAQNKKDTFVLRQTAKQILAQERIILGRKLVTAVSAVLPSLLHRADGRVRCDKEIFTT